MCAGGGKRRTHIQEEVGSVAGEVGVQLHRRPVSPQRPQRLESQRAVLGRLAALQHLVEGAIPCARLMRGMTCQFSAPSASLTMPLAIR